MDLIRKILAYFLAASFIFTAILALVLFNFDRRAYRAETYQAALAQGNFYNRIPAVMAEAMMSSSVNFQGLPFAMRSMTTKAWTDFFRTLLPADTLKLIGDDTFNQLFAYLNMQSNSVKISLLPIKANMGTESGVQAVFTLFRTQPDCTLSQVAQMTIALLNAQEIAFCNPPEELTPLLSPVIQAELQTAALLLPNEVTIIDSTGIQKDPRGRIKTTRTLMKLSPLLPIGFLFFLTITIVNSMKSWLTWWGVPILSTGLLSMLMSITASPILGAIFKQIITRRAGTLLPASISNYAGDLASALVSAILRPVFWEGLILFFVGLGMVLIAVYIKQKATLKLKDITEAKTVI